MDFGDLVDLETISDGTLSGERNGLDYARLTPAQLAYVSDGSPCVLWRGGNQLGKSWGNAWDCMHFARGTHPYRSVRRGAKSILVTGVSLDQMEPLMSKLWSLAPRDELDEKCGFDPGRSITGKPPRLVFASGPGRGTVIHFASYAQGAKRIAGGTHDAVYLDEPPPEQVYGEVLLRVMKKRGFVRIGMTPTPDMPDVSYLRKIVEDPAGGISEHVHHLCEANCWPEGYPFPWLRQWEIDLEIAKMLPYERQMRVYGAWDPLVTGRVLVGFTPENVRPASLPRSGVFFGIGIDWSASAGRQAVMLIAIQFRETERPRVWFIDEYRPDSPTSVDEDAKAILRMLAKNGLDYDDIEMWIGDRQTQATKIDIVKSNKMLRREIARLLKRDIAKETLPIIVPYKHRGSVEFGMRLLNTLFMRRDEGGNPMVYVDPQCVHFIAACEQFQGARQDPHKDMLDAGRYIVESAIRGASIVSFQARY